MGNIGISPIGPEPVSHIYPLFKLFCYLDKEIPFSRIDAVGLSPSRDYLPNPVLIDRLGLVFYRSKIEDVPVLGQFCHIVIYDFIEIITEKGIILTDENPFAILDGLEDFYVAQSASHNRVNTYLFAIYGVVNFKPEACFLCFFIELF